VLHFLRGLAMSLCKVQELFRTRTER